jgi:hypothetical protein
MPCLVIQEDGKWKFDLAHSMERMMSGSLAPLVEGLGKAMEGIGQAMAEGMEKAFEGIGQALGGETAPLIEQPQSWDDVSMTPAEEEFLPPLEMETLPKTQAAFSEAVGSPVVVQAALKEILQRSGSDEHDTIFNWFEDQLFAGWAPFLAQAAQHIPLKDRLRALRIEPATRVETRLLALDGNDVVYRMNLPSDQGFYQDDEVWNLLPGVLAGLPEAIDPASAGRRLLPVDDEIASVGFYRQLAAPRFMKRISDIMGHYVGLEIKWDDFEAWPQAGKLLATWGLGRILGGVALSHLPAALAEGPVRDFQRVCIFLPDQSADSSLGFDGDAMFLGLRCYTEFDRGSYETEIAEALMRK